MKRIERLFCGKRTDNDEWVEGRLIADDVIIPCEQDFVIEDGYYIKFENELIGYAVAPETVGQYIGLDDKNGKKIFEGDILKDSTGLTRSVKWEMSCGSCCTQTIGFGASGDGHTDFISLSNLKDVEIIGNVHDNPELLFD